MLMIRFYSLFITDDDLLASPFIQKFNLFHDINLQRGSEETVNFLLQTPLTQTQCKKLNIISDPHSIDILETEVKSFRHQTLISIRLIPKEVGSARIGIAFPQSETLHDEKMNSLPSRFVSMPCENIQKSASEYKPSRSTVSVS